MTSTKENGGGRWFRRNRPTRTFGNPEESRSEQPPTSRGSVGPASTAASATMQPNHTNNEDMTTTTTTMMMMMPTAAVTPIHGPAPIASSSFSGTPSSSSFVGYPRPSRRKAESAVYPSNPSNSSNHHHSNDTLAAVMPSCWIIPHGSDVRGDSTGTRVYSTPRSNHHHRHHSSNRGWSSVVSNNPVPTEAIKQVAMKRRNRRSMTGIGGPPPPSSSSSPLGPEGGGAYSNLIRKKGPSSTDTRSMYPALANNNSSSSNHPPNGSYHPHVDNDLDLQRSTTQMDVQSSVDVYYFETSIQRKGASGRIGFVSGAKGNSTTPPGNMLHSIGMDSKGRIHVANQIVEETAPPWQRGDVIGCGMELFGMRRVFWTRNGQLLAPPAGTNLDLSETHTYPCVALAEGAETELVTNFLGPFLWGGGDRLSLISPQERLADSMLSSSASPSSPTAKKYPDPSSLYDTPMGNNSNSSSNHQNGTRLAMASSSSAAAASPPPPTSLQYGSSSRSAMVGPSPSSTAGTPTLFGRKAKRGTLEDDNPNVDGIVIGGMAPPPASMPSSSLGSLGSASSGEPNIYRPSANHNTNIDMTRMTMSMVNPPAATPDNTVTTAPPSNGPSSSSSRTTSRGRSNQQTTNHRKKHHRQRSSGGGHSNSGGPNQLRESDIAAIQRSVATTSDKAEEDMVNAAIQKSVNKKKKNLVVLMTAQEISEAKSFARELRGGCSQSSVDVSSLQSLLEVCKNLQKNVKKALEDAMKYDPSMVDLEELFTVNDVLLDAISTANAKIKPKESRSSTSTRRAASGVVVSGSNDVATPLPSSVRMQSAPRETAPVSRRQTTRSLEIDSLVRKKDIFSLICMLRAQSEKRLDSALALMRFARAGERKGDAESLRVRNEIRSSGGMHSLLTLFRTKGTTRELKVIAALAVAYLLPPFVDSSSLSSPNLALKIVECLRFLFGSRPVSPKGQEITQMEMYHASVMGLTTFWINAFFPMLQKEADRQASSNDKAIMTRSRGRGKFSGGGDRKESLEVQELLEMTVSLIVSMAKLSDAEGSSQPASELNLRYTLVEQMCAVDVARPIAVREGLLKVLVDWMKSRDRDKVRPAATALRDLTSTHDKYMAGWIHSQIVNEGSLGEMVELSVSQSVGHDVRLAVAQILSSLCVAPHTRAAVVEAQCINYLIPLLYDHADPSSQEVAFAAGSALLQLAAGAMTRASVYRSDNADLNEAGSTDKRDKVINDIVHGGAIGPLVAMARSGVRGKLRYMSIEALQIISEDTHPTRLTRLQLCEDGAAEALGHVLKDDVSAVADVLRPTNQFQHRPSELNSNTTEILNELHQALCTLANILDPMESPRSMPSLRYTRSRLEDSEELLIKGCVQTAKSGGLKSLLWIATIPVTNGLLSDASDSVNSIDLLIEACRLLAALSPLLLSDLAAIEGYTSWTCEVLKALTTILGQHAGVDDDDRSGVSYMLKNDALRGLSALAKSEPLKIRIVDSSLPYLLQAKTSSDNRNKVANAANQVCMSLGVAEDELAVQVAGNDPKLLGDWFCMQRSLLIQAMAREELRIMLSRIWKDAVLEAKRKGLLAARLTRETSGQSSSSHHSDEELNGLDEFFENLARDHDSFEWRDSVIIQYENVYASGKDVTRSDPSFPRLLSMDDTEDVNEGQLSRHIYPLNNTEAEKDWILSHSQFLKNTRRDARWMPDETERVQHLLDSCIPSQLLQSEILPVFDLRPEASFNFRALVMPQRRYFSFRREGQMVSRLCDKHAAALDSDNVHCTLGFTNSSFAGEFNETLVQALYRCPMIRGLSFSRNSNWARVHSADKENETDDGGAVLANLVGSLPPWVSYMTYDNILNDFALHSFVKILETMGKLSATQGKGRDMGRMSLAPGVNEVVGQKQGSFQFFAIRNSVHLSREAWAAFFDLIGRVDQGGGIPSPPRPLSSLCILDLSGNNLGDEGSAFILNLVHHKGSRSMLEQLDLSRNDIREGKSVIRVLRSYIDKHRYNQSAGLKMTSRTWRSNLHTLNLSSNSLYEGNLALEIVAFLKNNALSLKTLNLSNNKLRGEGYQFTEVLCASISKNTCIRELDLSRNCFSLPVIDGVVERLSRSESESGLAFLRFDNNSPRLSEQQIDDLESLSKHARKVALERFLSDKERIKNGESLDIPMIAERNPSLTIPNWDSRRSLLKEDDEYLDKFHYSTDADSLRGTSTDFAREKPAEKGENMITVLFSAPLVFHDEQRKLRPFAKLDFDMERELLWQCLKEASRDIELSFDNATHHRLLAAMTKRCSCLHYSGHGHPAYLPLENGKGGPHWLEVNVLKELIVQGGGAPFKFVFVSACHSGLAGETFASAGVPHVVCCQQESELKDTAALAFTRQFYLSLAVGHTVKESFDQGCKAVRATPNLRNAEEEMKKFVLLPRDGNHDVPVFNARPLREWPKTGSSRSLNPRKSSRKGLTRSRSLYFGGARSSELSVRNMMQEDPSPTPPQFFLGREVDMYHTLGAVLTKRLVSVVGDTGCGRSSLVCALCHYINERSSTIMEVDRIFFVKTKQLRGGDRCRALIQSLLNKLVEDGKAHPQQPTLDMEDLFDVICKALKPTKALIVFDRTELLEDNDEAQDFPLFLSNLFRETRNVRVVLTGRQPLGIPSIGGVVEHPYYLRGLNFANTVRLFANLSPHLHTPAERQQFFMRVITDGEQADLCHQDHNMSERTKKMFHILGNGMPAQTEKAAYAIQREQVASLGTD